MLQQPQRVRSTVTDGQLQPPMTGARCPGAPQGGKLSSCSESLPLVCQTKSSEVMTCSNLCGSAWEWESQTICSCKISSPRSTAWRQESFSLLSDIKIISTWHHGLRPSKSVESKWIFNHRYMQCKTKSQLKFMSLCWAMLTRHNRARKN